MLPSTYSSPKGPCSLDRKDNVGILEPVPRELEPGNFAKPEGVRPHLHAVDGAASKEMLLLHHGAWNTTLLMPPRPLVPTPIRKSPLRLPS